MDETKEKVTPKDAEMTVQIYDQMVFENPTLKHEDPEDMERIIC